MTQKISALSCDEFTADLASRSPAPGGGGAAALMASLAASLCSMAGSLTLGKKKYAAFETDHIRIIERAQELRVRFLELIEEDAAAFEPLSRAYSKPKTDPDYAEVICRESLAACRAPFEMLRLCCETTELLEEMLEKCSVLLISDVGCGAAAVSAAMKAAAMNVFVNTRVISDNAEAQALEAEAGKLLSEYIPRAEKVSDSVISELRRKKNG